MARPKNKQKKDTDLAPQFKVLHNWLTELYPLQTQFDIVGFKIEFTMVDLNWCSFNLRVGYFETDNTHFKQSIHSFIKPCTFSTTSEEAYKMVFDECKKLKIRTPQAPIEWLRKMDEQIYLGTEWTAQRFE